MYEAKDCLTGVCIKDVIGKVLPSFDLKFNQIYSIISNSGRNMIKVAEILIAENDIYDPEEEIYNEDYLPMVSYDEEVNELDITH